MCKKLYQNMVPQRLGMHVILVSFYELYLRFKDSKNMLDLTKINKNSSSKRVDSKWFASRKVFSKRGSPGGWRRIEKHCSEASTASTPACAPEDAAVSVEFH